MLLLYHTTVVTVITVQLGFDHCRAVLLCKLDQGDHKPGKLGVLWRFLRTWRLGGILSNCGPNF